MINTKLTLQQLVPFGMITVKKWLLSQGVGLHRVDNALKSSKLMSLARGVYAREGMPVSWEGVVSSLQQMSEQAIQVGGLSALELLGFSQYVSQNKRTIHLYAKNKLPTWLGRLTLPTKFIFHNTKKIWPDNLALDKFTIEHQWRNDLPPIKVSCPEKAYLEMLMSIPKDISFEHADEIMQSMTSLSPKKLKMLLQACQSIKVKRLFFWLAERHNYSWSHKLDYREYDLGKGNRVIADKGKLDTKFFITVPVHMHG